MAAFDAAPIRVTRRPDDEGVDVELFTLFMRSTLAPPRDPALRGNAGRPGRQHAVQPDRLQRVPHPRDHDRAGGTLINGGAFNVPTALGNKIIHPFSDFLLHDVGTGDGIVQNGGQSTRNKVRTAPLWGLRARGRFMHDSLSFSLNEAIPRHGNQAASTRNAFNALSTTNKNRLFEFLLSL